MCHDVFPGKFKYNESRKEEEAGEEDGASRISGKNFNERISAEMQTCPQHTQSTLVSSVCADME